MRSRGSRWLPAGIHLAGLLLVVGGAQAAPTVAQKCQSGKKVAAGKYTDCGQKAEAKARTIVSARLGCPVAMRMISRSLGSGFACVT